MQDPLHNVFRATIMLCQLAFLFLGCGRQQPAPSNADAVADQRIDTVPAAQQSDEPVVYFGVISRYNPRIMFEGYQPIMDYLTEHTDYRFELKLGKTYEDAVQFLCDGKVQVASLGGVTYLEAHKRCDATPILRPKNRDGVASYRSMTVVRRNSPFRTLSDLRGQSFAFASLHSTSGNLIPRYYLAQAGVSIEDFSEYVNLKHHDSVAKAVLTGEYAAGAVKDIIADRYLGRGLRVLHVSDPIPSVPIVTRKDCDPKLAAAVRRALLAVRPNDPEMRAALAKWNAEFRYGFVPAKDADYQTLRDMMNTIPAKCGNSCHPPLTL